VNPIGSSPLQTEEEYKDLLIILNVTVILRINNTNQLNRILKQPLQLHHHWYRHHCQDQYRVALALALALALSETTALQDHCPKKDGQNSCVYLFQSSHSTE
jgi:hypothetical protein